MGYLIKEGGGEGLVKIETIIPAARMAELASIPQTLTSTQKPGFVFMLVAAFIQVNGSSPYNLFDHLWIWQAGGSLKNATFGRNGSNILDPGRPAAFIVNLDHGTTPTNKFGATASGTRDFILQMDSDDGSGDGDGKVTLYGYYLPDFV